MLRLDHFVININSSYQDDSNSIEKIRTAGFPYEPTWGKGTKGFKASNLWIGNEYFEMINLLTPDGGGWRKDWVDIYNQNKRGMICLFLETDNIDKDYEYFKSKNIEITIPEFLKFKWFFNLFTRTMPWRNCYFNFFKGVPLQIGLQQMKDEKSKDFFKSYMVPNSRDNKITGIKKVVIKGPFTLEDMNLIHSIFNESIIEKTPITIKLNDNQILIFEVNETYHVDMYTSCDNEAYLNRSITIENITIHNEA